MKAERAFEQIEVQLMLAGMEKDRLVLRALLETSVNNLLGTEEWSWAKKYLNPMLRTEANVDRVLLPADFGSNFIKGGKDGEDYAVKINDGSNDSDLYYEPAETFFSRSREGLSNRKPTWYTVQRVSGKPWMFLLDTPDASYDIWGAYKPEFYKFEELDDDIPVPGMFVVWDVLKMIDPSRGNWRENRDSALQGLYTEQTHKPRLYPQTGERNAVNAYDPQRL